MIKAIIFAAATLLVLQIGLTVAVYQQQAVNLESTTPNSAFLSFAPESITSVQINGPENEELVLQKSDKSWIMPGAFSAPASQGQVDELLKKLADARQGLAVATSKGAAKRFKTAEDNFERHVVLKKGDTVAGDFYLGTSAGMRNSHARQVDQQAVVSIPVSSHEVDADADSWLDRSLANLNKTDLKAVSLGDITLLHKEEGKEKVWVLDGASKEKTEQDTVDKLVNKITAISVQSVLDPEKSAALFIKDPAVQFTVTRQDDTTVSYDFAKKDDKKDDYFILKMSDNELYFKVGKWLVEDLTEAKREKLLVGYEEKKEEETPAAAQPVTPPALQPIVTKPQPIAQEAPQVETPEQESLEQAVLPELPPEDEEETAPVVQEEVEPEPVQNSEAVVENAQQTTPSEEAAVPEESKADSVVQDTQPVEQNTAQELVSEETPEQEQVQEDVQQIPVDDSAVEESSREQKQEAVSEEEASE